MRKDFTILIFLILFILFERANAQTELALYSRHKLSDGIVDIPNSDDTNIIVPFGFAAEIIRDRNEHKVYSYGGGFRIRNHELKDEGTTNEIFVQVKIILFKDFAKSEKLSAYFSLAPRLAYLFNDNTGVGGVFDSEVRKSGIELPFLFSVDYSLSDRLNIHFNLNTVTAAFFSDYQVIQNPAIPPNLRSNSGFDFDGNLFNEMRIGVGYTLNTK